jgi:hypothetical protein
VVLEGDDERLRIGRQPLAGGFDHVGPEIEAAGFEDVDALAHGKPVPASLIPISWVRLPVKGGMAATKWNSLSSAAEDRGMRARPMATKRESIGLETIDVP